MITYLANVIADFFVDNNIINSKEWEVYVYGSEALLSAFLNTIIVLLSGLVTHEINNAFIFYFVFLLMRKYCGRYHAKTHLRCNLVLTLNILTILMLIKNISTISVSFYVSAIVISNILVIWLAPIENENKPLENFEIKKYKKIAIILCSIFTVIIVLLIPFYKTVSIIITLALFSVSSAMLITKLMKEVEGNRNAD